MVRGGRAINEAVLLIALVFLCVLYAVDAAPTLKKSHIRMQKLCSKKLADALYTTCKDRGYNEPFSEEYEPREPGPGLVEECCYHACTIEQLEAYCKPLPKEQQETSWDDVIDESYVANKETLPHSTTKDPLEQQSETDYAGDAIKRFAQQP